MSATSGRSSLKQFAYFDRDSSCWRTWPAISLWGPETFSATLPKRGSMRSGALYEHPTWVPATAASGCSSLLPTPNASDFRGSTSPESAKDWAQRGVNLPERIQRLRRLPTPTARDHKGQNQRKDTSCLPGAITSLPSIDTPSSSDDDRLPLWTSADASPPDSWSG